MDQILIFVFFGLVFGWLVILSLYVHKMADHYRRLTSGTHKEQLSEIIADQIKEVHNNKQDIEKLTKEFNTFIADSVRQVQKIGLIRYNPFADTGGGQSFVLAILDGNDTGIVLTSLHHRGSTRWYAKKVKNGKGIDLELSEEEKDAIKKSSNSKS